MLPAGAIVGDYEIETELGAGTAAMVFRARHRTSGQRYALKMARAGEDREIQDSLLDEAAVLADIENNFVIRCFGSLEYEDRPALVLEFVDGPALDEWQAAHDGPIPVATALQLFRKVALGLASCHRYRVVHRDLKPENILLAPGLIPKLSDFGMAKRMQGGHLEGHRGLSRFYRQFGTPEYMSPEQMMSAELADHRADLWSLGVLLYELLCNRPPFEGTRQEIFAASTMGDFRPAREIRTEIPEVVDEIIAALLQCDEEDRPQDVAAVLTTLPGM